MITGINELRTTKRNMYQTKVNVNLIQIKSGITINVDASAKFITYVKKDYIQNSATCSCKNGKYLASITDYSAIMCDETIDAEAKSQNEEIKTVTKNFNEKNTICKTKKFYILLAFLLIIIALLIAVSVYCYLIKYNSTQKP